MPGAWEIRQQNSVLCAILSVDFTTVAWSFGVRNLIVPGQMVSLQGMPFDMSRNAACSKVLNEGWEYLFFLDSDVIPPRDAVLRLLSHRLPIVSGVYCRRSPPHGIPVMLKDGKWITEYKQNSLIDVDLVGAGCLLIHRSVLERMPPSRPEAGKHWFDWKVDCRGILPDGECLSEDFVFCLNARRKLGLKIFVDTSIQCRHIGFSEYTYGKCEPLNTLAMT